MTIPPGELFLGEQLDPATRQRNGTSVTLDPAELTTHGVIVGMTGSGKTGLGMVVIEEALLQRIPVLMVDLKGDLTNLLLTFPDLAPEQFAPWLDPALVAGGDPAPVAEAEAKKWRDGLASWGIGPERIAALRAAAAMTVYTPGSTAGVPLSLVGSLLPGGGGASAGPLDDESRAEQIDATVAGLLGLVGIESDPLSGRDHILLANLLASAWAAGTPLDLATLIGMVQQPPLRKLGVIELDTFFPPADRTTLAMKLNGLLASPSFAAWSRGDPIDFDVLFTAPDGRPRAAIVTLAHLGDAERQFVLARLLGALVGWMRRQPGTSSLRALVYIDELFGFVPPNGAPPAKRPILTLLKQARAFGVGLLLATQNPVDLDYKALGNAGTWMVGRLQTEQDVNRLADGMTATTGGDTAALKATVAALQKREFLLRRTGTGALTLFGSRWAMSYLRGPIPREQLALLASPPEPATSSGAPAPEVGTSSPPAAADEVLVAPTVAAGIRVAHVDPAAPWVATVGGQPGSARLQAALAATVTLHYDETSLGLVHDEVWEAVLTPLGDPLDVDGTVAVDHDPRDFVDAAPAGARFVTSDAALEKSAWFTKAKSEIVARLQRDRTLTVERNATLKLASRPGETSEQFAARCRAAADEREDQEADELRASLTTKIDRINDAIAKAQDRVEAAEQRASTARTNELVGGAGSLLSSFLGGRRTARGIAGDVRGAASRRGTTSAARGRVEEAQNRLAEKVDDLHELEQELADSLVELADTWSAAAADIEAVEVPLEKTDIRVDALTLVWLPV